MSNENEFKIEIRDPKSTDIFTVLRIIGKLKIKREILAMSNRIAQMNKKARQLKAYTNKKKKDENDLMLIDKLADEVETLQTELGMEMPFILMENLEKAEDEVFKFFASITGLSIKECHEMGAEFIIDIFDEIKRNENWKKVFTKALELFQR